MERNELGKIFDEEFNFHSELKQMRGAGEHRLADSVERFITALTSTPTRWLEAEQSGEAIVAMGCVRCPELEHLRNTVMRTILPLLSDLPKNVQQMTVAQTQPHSNHAQALAAARVLQIFSSEFSPH
jgi:hypothetical protein